MKLLMPQYTDNSGTVGQPITEEVDAPVIYGPSGHPIIGRFNANIPSSVVEQDGYFRGKWFEKIAGFLFKRAD